MRATLLAAGVLLVGCRKPPAVENHYYSLVLEASDDRAMAAPAGVRPRVDLVEVTLPDFLMSRSLVIQVNTNELRHARHHHWGEPLHGSVPKVLAWDLSAQLPGLDIASGHGRGADCVVDLEFDRFHATDDARVLVSGRYTFKQGGQQVRREFDVSQVQHGDGYTNAVRGMRRALADLSQEMGKLVAGCEAQPSAEPPG